MLVTTLRAIAMACALLMAGAAYGQNDPCGENNTVDKVSMHVGDAYLHLLTKQLRCIALNESFYIKIITIGNVPGIDQREVSVSEVENDYVSIQGGGLVGEGEILVTVTKKANSPPLPDDPTFKYDVKIETIGTLDPKVRVIGEGIYRSMLWNAFEHFVEFDLNMTTEEFETFFRNKGKGNQAP